MHRSRRRPRIQQALLECPDRVEFGVHVNLQDKKPRRFLDGARIRFAQMRLARAQLRKCLIFQLARDRAVELLTVSIVPQFSERCAAGGGIDPGGGSGAETGGHLFGRVTTL